MHSHFGNIGWADQGAVEKLGIRHVTTFYGLDVNRLPVSDARWRARYVELFGSVDRVLCEGPHMARCLLDLGCPEEKITVQHLGVNLSEIDFAPRNWAPGEPLRVLIAATFREKKGIPYAIEALGALRNEVDLEITIIGDATTEARSLEEKGRILETLAQCGLQERTRLLGFRPHRELLEQAYRHHIFLSPSVTASDGDTEGGAPVTIIELAASGMPIVSTRHCDIPNVLPKEMPLAEERDVDGLVRILRSWIGSAGGWEPQLLEARRHVERNFDSRIQGQRLGEIYSQTIGNYIGKRN
jgi:colanic acid/amylovoran biosynthesis glycosyltransferase